MNSSYKEKTLHISLKDLSFDYSSKVKSMSNTQKGNLNTFKKKSILKTLMNWFEKLKSIFNSKVIRYIIYLAMKTIFGN
jgi:hypothetical protein